MGFFKKLFTREKKEKLDSGVQQTKNSIWSQITKVIAGKKKVDEDMLDAIEEALIMSDVGVDTTVKIIGRLEKRVEKDKFINTDDLANILCDEICDLIGENHIDDDDRTNDFSIDTTKGVPYVIMVVGVNGVGKTTTIGKLAHQYKNAGYSVMLGACDTFRAAADNQLTIWAERADVPIVKHTMGSDPASVAFDTLKSAKAKNIDVVIIDTAGRLHNKIGLMDELAKISRVMKRVVPEAPQEVLLVLDASTGQNAIEQAKAFAASTGVNCMAVTKLDGTAKGGAVIGICDQLKIPVKYIGLGEQVEDLQIFRPDEFVRSLFENAINTNNGQE